MTNFCIPPSHLQMRKPLNTPRCIAIVWSTPPPVASHPFHSAIPAPRKQTKRREAPRTGSHTVRSINLHAKKRLDALPAPSSELITTYQKESPEVLQWIIPTQNRVAQAAIEGSRPCSKEQESAKRERRSSLFSFRLPFSRRAVAKSNRDGTAESMSNHQPL